MDGTPTMPIENLVYLAIPTRKYAICHLSLNIDHTLKFFKKVRPQMTSTVFLDIPPSPPLCVEIGFYADIS